jgi:hypothetical protein
MNNFQKFILFFAVFILIITFISIGLAIHNSKIISWPPIVPSCPDYWLIDGSGNNTKCINSKDLGTCQPSSGDRHLIMDFNDAPYVGSNGNCAKYTWANNCNLSWDGINYGVSNPCNSSAPSNSTTNSSNLFDWFMTKKNNYT